MYYSKEKNRKHNREQMSKSYSKPKKRPDVPTMRKHVRQKMPDCLAIAWLQHDAWL